MHKLVFSVLSFVVLLMMPFHSVAQNPAAAPSAPAATPAPIDYFKAGQFDEFSNYTSWIKIYQGDDLTGKFNDGRALYVAAGATDKVLASYDAMAKTVTGLPMSTSYSDWTQAQKDAWNASGLDGNALTAWLGSSDKAPSFFFWLGFESMRMGKAMPEELGDWGNTISATASTWKAGLSEFVALNTQYPTVMKTVSPDVAAAIKAIAKYNAKGLDPMGNGLSKDDFTAIQTQAQIILDAASNGKLTQ